MVNHRPVATGVQGEMPLQECAPLFLNYPFSCPSKPPPPFLSSNGNSAVDQTLGLSNSAFATIWQWLSRVSAFHITCYLSLFLAGDAREQTWNLLPAKHIPYL